MKPAWSRVMLTEGKNILRALMAGGISEIDEKGISRAKKVGGEACETQVWVEFARRCDYLEDKICNELDGNYDRIMAQIVKMINEADKWLIK